MANLNNIPMNWNGPPKVDDSLYPAFRGPEPDAVDHLAAIVDPDGEGAKRIESWKKSQELLKNLTKASDEIFKRTQRGENNWIKASPQVARTILEGLDVECG